MNFKKVETVDDKDQATALLKAALDGKPVWFGDKPMGLRVDITTTDPGSTGVFMSEQSQKVAFAPPTPSAEDVLACLRQGRPVWIRNNMNNWIKVMPHEATVRWTHAGAMTVNSRYLDRIAVTEPWK